MILEAGFRRGADMVKAPVVGWKDEKDLSTGPVGSGISGILAVSDLQSHHRAGGNHPRSFWDPLLHIKLGFKATTLLKRGT